MARNQFRTAVGIDEWLECEAGAETVTVSFVDGTYENIDSRWAAELAAHFAEANIPEVFRLYRNYRGLRSRLGRVELA